MSLKIHIVSFDVPFPADYGGVIDVYYKIKALHAMGVKIHLHCFEYHRPPAPELELLCEKVDYYPRKISSSLLFHKLPYIVISRQSEQLIQTLQKNNWPILLEGLHCTWLMNDQYWPNRKVIVRTHNIEHVYYQQLARAEKNLFKKYYFLSESTKLESYEPILSNATGIATITEKEREYFNRYHHSVKTISGFHGHNEVLSKSGSGNYILYHGNLSIAENNKAAIHLVQTFKDSGIPLVIAGSSPRKELRELCKHSTVTLVANPTEEEMFKLIENAHINILISFQDTGLKLKLLYALFRGRHCMVNRTMVEGTGLEDAVILVDANNKNELISQVSEQLKTSFTESDIKERGIMLQPFYDSSSAEKLIKMLQETL